MLFQFGFYHDLRSNLHFNNQQILYFLSLRYFLFHLLFFLCTFIFLCLLIMVRSIPSVPLLPVICQAFVILSLPAVGNSICLINIVLFLIFHLKYVNLDKQDNTLLV